MKNLFKNIVDFLNSSDSDSARHYKISWIPNWLFNLIGIVFWIAVLLALMKFIINAII